MNLHLLHLDYLSCVLTVGSTILVGRKRITGWWIAALNSVLICLIGIGTRQYGFIPANLFCLGLYAVNIRSWKQNLERQAAEKKLLQFAAEIPETAGNVTGRLFLVPSVRMPGR